jgi:DNA-binding MarR family transcriptional regulator
MIIDPMLLDQQLCFALYAATHAITRCYSPGLKALGLTYPQYLVMLVLWQEDALTLKALAERLDLDSPTLTPLLKRLEASGYITRERSRVDERALEIRLTDTGRDLREHAQTGAHRSVDAIGSGARRHGAHAQRTAETERAAEG